MIEHNKRYSFVISMHELQPTVRSLWQTVKGAAFPSSLLPYANRSMLDFRKDYPDIVSADNSLPFISDDKGETYNYCHCKPYSANLCELNSSSCNEQSGRTSKLLTSTSSARTPMVHSSITLTSQETSTTNAGEMPLSTASLRRSCFHARNCISSAILATIIRRSSIVLFLRNILN